MTNITYQEGNQWLWARQYERHFLKAKEECKEHQVRAQHKWELVLVVIAASILGNFIVDFTIGWIATGVVNWQTGGLALSILGLCLVACLYWRSGRNPLVNPKPAVIFEISALDLFRLLPFQTARQTYDALKEIPYEGQIKLAKAVSSCIKNYFEGSFLGNRLELINETPEVSADNNDTILIGKPATLTQLWNVSHVLDESLIEWFGRSPKLESYLKITIRVKETTEQQQILMNPITVRYRLWIKNPSEPMSAEFIGRFASEILPQLGGVTGLAIHHAVNFSD